MGIPDPETLAQKHAGSSPQQILTLAFELFGEDQIALSFSGSEDVALVDMAVRLRPQVQVFFLDTGRLHPETYRFLEEIREHYKLPLQMLTADTQQVEELVRKKGLFSFYRDGHHECCAIRKVMPLQRCLANLMAWITGQRSDQSPDTRSDLPVIQTDHNFSDQHRQLYKFNPLANWSSAQVWAYIHEHKVPFNPLHARGFVSIGCEPCTRAILPHQQERAGRWWWEQSEKKECGLHVGGNDANTAMHDNGKKKQ